MKGFLFGCCSTLTLLTLGGSAAHADRDTPEPRTLAVASFSGYGELKRDLEYLCTLSGNAQSAAELERLLIPLSPGRELAGLDQQRPWGTSLAVSDEETH